LASGVGRSEGTLGKPVWLALLERFDRHRAAARNGSFRYFLRKHLPEALAA